MKQYDPEYIKDIYKQVRFELKEAGGDDYDFEVIGKHVRDYFGTVVKLLNRGNKNKFDSFVDRIIVPYLGAIKFKPAHFNARQGNKKPSQITKLKSLEISKYVFSRKWFFMGWTPREGYIFKQMNEDRVHRVKYPDITNTYDAYSRFKEILDNNYEYSDIPITFFPVFTPVEVRIGRIFGYDENKKVVSIFETFEDVMKYTGFGLTYLYKAAHDNSYIITSRLVCTRGLFLFFEGMFKDYKYKSLNERKHNYLINIYDSKTNELLYYKYGNTSDVKSFLQQQLLNKNIRTSDIIYAMKHNYSFHGYRFKKYF